MQEIYRAVNDIMRPEKMAKNNLQMEINNELVEDPEKLVEHINDFFVEKPVKLVEKIKKPQRERDTYGSTCLDLNSRFLIKTRQPPTTQIHKP